MACGGGIPGPVVVSLEIYKLHLTEFDDHEEVLTEDEQAVHDKAVAILNSYLLAHVMEDEESDGLSDEPDNGEE